MCTATHKRMSAQTNEQVTKKVYMARFSAYSGGENIVIFLQTLSSLHESNKSKILLKCVQNSILLLFCSSNICYLIHIMQCMNEC